MRLITAGTRLLPMPPKVAHRHNTPVSCHLREDLRHTVINS
jgi:hypothetical protein